MAQDELDLLEKPLDELLRRIEALQSAGGDPEALAALRLRLDERRREIYSHLTPWQTTLLARHSKRPYTLDFVTAMMTDWMELAGDRAFANDRAVVTGMAAIEGIQVMAIGHQKGRDTKEKLSRNFGMPRPEGYRKALRAMKLAEKFGRPVITFIDTPGAHPGLDAEERGQAEAIARNLREMAGLRVPIVAVVTGEGGSGGALALGVADHVAILEHAIYSVISPEGCAAILWRDASRNRDAAEALRLTAKDLAGLGVIDEIVPEPLGGAHLDPAQAAALLQPRLVAALTSLSALGVEERLDRRYQKFRRMGAMLDQ